MTNMSEIFPGEEYIPDMAEFPAGTGFIGTHTTSGNKVSIVVQFQLTVQTGGVSQFFVSSRSSDLKYRCIAFARSDDFSTVDQRERVGVLVQSSSANLAYLFSPVGYLDGEKHTLVFNFDGDAGTADFTIDGTDVDDLTVGSRVAPTAGTVAGGKGQLCIGVGHVANLEAKGKLAQVAYDDSNVDWRDFVNPDGRLNKIDTVGWTAFSGSQPVFFEESANGMDNKGSAGPISQVGDITFYPKEGTPYTLPARDANWDDVIFLLPRVRERLEIGTGSYINFTESSPKFGDTSVEFLSPSSSNGLEFTLPQSLGTLDFTIEGWIWPIAGGAGQNYGRLIQMGNNSTNGGLYIVRSNNPNPLYLLLQTYNSGYQTVFNPSGATMANDTWAHLAITRESGTWAIYVNGTRYATKSGQSGDNITQTEMHIGANNSGSEDWEGRINNLRITRGLARYTGTSFDVPFYEFPDR